MRGSLNSSNTLTFELEYLKVGPLTNMAAAARLKVMKKTLIFIEKIKNQRAGQALIEYLLMTLMLLSLSIGLYRLLQGQLRIVFTKAGVAILTAYF